MAIAGILLAAGSSSRFGRNKLLLELDGEPLVRRAARRAREAGLEPLVVVVGHEAGRVRDALDGIPCRIVENREWARGQATSLSAGVAAVPEACEAAVVLLADMPRVTPEVIRGICTRWRETGAPIVTSRYGEVTAPPTLYARSALADLTGGEGERRGREVVRRRAAEVVAVDWPEAMLADLDRPEDLEAIGAAVDAGGGSGGSGGGGGTGAGRAASGDDEVLGRAATWLADGRGAALATVTSTWGSSLRPAGSQLAVSGQGELAGSVSGGCVESAVAGEAMAAIADGRLRRLSYGVTDEQAWAVGLPCGGRIEVAVKPVDGGVLARLREDVAARRPVVLALDLVTGEETLLHPGDAAGALDGPLSLAAQEALRLDRASVVREGASEVLLRPFQAPPRLVVVGAVHVAQALVRMAEAAGLDAVVVDPRRAFATADRFPGVALVAEWPDEAFGRIGLRPRDAVVTLAHDAKIDDPALAAALRTGCFFVGALGSRRSHAARLERLRREGVGEAELARIQGPVGLAIGAITPGEIAASILAAVVQALRRPA